MLCSDLATISEALYIQGVKATLWPELATGLTFFCTTHNIPSKVRPHSSWNIVIVNLQVFMVIGSD